MLWGSLSSWRTGRLVGVEGQVSRAKRKTSLMVTCSWALWTLDWGENSSSNNNSKHTTKIRKEWLQDPLWVPLCAPARAQTWTNTPHPTLVELVRFCKEVWEKRPINMCSKLLASYLKRACFNKVLSKDSEYLCVCYVFVFNTFAKTSSYLFSLSNDGVLCA